MKRVVFMTDIFMAGGEKKTDFFLFVCSLNTLRLNEKSPCVKYLERVIAGC